MAAAQSNSDEKSVDIVGNVTPLCVLGQPSRVSIDLGSLAATSGQRVGRMSAVGPQQATLPGSFCNFAGTTLRVSATALVAADTAEVQPGFARAVNFRSTVTNWGSAGATVSTSATSGGASPSASASSAVQGTPRLADLQLTLSEFQAPSDALLVAGGYSGIVTITLSPAAVD
jgi:hypothetical protein